MSKELNGSNLWTKLVYTCLLLASVLCIMILVEPFNVFRWQDFITSGVSHTGHTSPQILFIASD